MYSSHQHSQQQHQFHFTYLFFFLLFIWIGQIYFHLSDVWFFYSSSFIYNIPLASFRTRHHRHRNVFFFFFCCCLHSFNSNYETQVNEEKWKKIFRAAPPSSWLDAKCNGRVATAPVFFDFCGQGGASAGVIFKYFSLTVFEIIFFFSVFKVILFFIILNFIQSSSNYLVIITLYVFIGVWLDKPLLTPAQQWDI